MLRGWGNPASTEARNEDIAKNAVEKKSIFNNDQSTDRFTKMLGLGIPPHAVRHAMDINGFSSADVDTFLNSYGPNPNGADKDSGPPLKDDPEYAKYFRMLKAKVPHNWVRRVLEVDEKDPAVLDMDPERSYASQINNLTDHSNKNEATQVKTNQTSHEETRQRSAKNEGNMANSKTSPMPNSTTLSIAPAATEAAAMAKNRAHHEEGERTRRPEPDRHTSENKSCPSADKKETPVSSSVTVATVSVASEVATMAKMRQRRQHESSGGLDAGRSNKSSAGQCAIRNDIQCSSHATDISVDAKNGPCHVRNAPNNVFFPSRNQSNTTNCANDDDSEVEAALKDDPEYAKYFRMLRARVPLTRVRNVLEVDGKNPSIINLDPNKPLAHQLARLSYESKKDSEQTQKSSNSNECQLPERQDSPRSIMQYVDQDSLTGSPLRAVSMSGRDILNRELLQSGSQRTVADFNPTIEAKPWERRVSFKAGNDMVSSLRIDCSEAPIKCSTETEPEALLSKSNSSTIESTQSKALHAQLESQLDIRSSSSDSSALKQSSKNFTPNEKSPKNDAEKEKKTSGGHLPLKDDPKFSKYYRMLKLNLPVSSVKKALKRDGKNPGIIDLDPNKPLKEQEKDLAKMFTPQKSDVSSDGPALKDDPKFSKYYKMLKLRIPVGAVKQALKKDGKDPAIIDLDPNKPLKEQEKDLEKKSTIRKKSDKISAPVDGDGPALKDDPEFSKYFKMLKMNIPVGAVKQALQRDGKDPAIIDLDPNKPLKQHKSGCDEDPALKDDPEFSKYFKMLKMNVPVGGVKQALQRDGKDPAIIDLDPNKSLKSQKVESKASIALKDDPEYSKYFKMLKMNIQLEAVKQALTRDGKDPGIADLDPEKPLSEQKAARTDATKSCRNKGKLKLQSVVRKKLFWTSIDKSKLRRDSLWAKAQSEPLSLEGLDYDTDEFASLFTSIKKGKNDKSTAASTSQTTKTSKQQKVQLIDDRRNMNGSILLAKFKNKDFNELAKSIDQLNCMDMGETELCALRQLLPTKDESLALQSYLPAPGTSAETLKASIDKLGDCEKYMAAMLNVTDVSRKFDCLLYKARFDGRIEEVTKEIDLLQKACTSVRECDKLQRLLVFALRLGNQLNTGGSGKTVSAITLDSLLKLHEAKAFDKKTSVLHYLVSIVKKNDSDVLSLVEELKSIRDSERIVGDALAKDVKELVDGLDLVKTMANDESKSCLKVLNDETSSEASCKEYCAKDVSLKVDHYLRVTSIGKFTIEAESKLKCVSSKFETAINNFSDLLNYFGEDETMPTDVFFTTLNRFLSTFKKAREEMERKERAKLRREKMAEKQKSSSKTTETT